MQLGKRSIIRNNCCYDVPLLESLRNLLTCKVVEKQVLVYSCSQLLINNVLCIPV